MKKWELWEVEKLIPDFKKKFSDKIIEWNSTTLFEWEYKLLLHIEAINDKGILCNYPILQVNDDIFQDYNGDLREIERKVYELSRDARLKSKPLISWCPRGYSLWIKIKGGYTSEEKKDYAVKVNTPPIMF